MSKKATKKAAVSLATKKKNKVSLATIFNIVCVALMVAFLSVQLFTPFWTYETEVFDITVTDKGDMEKETVSLGEYVWFTREHKELFGHWKNMSYPINGVETPLTQNEIVTMPFVTTLLMIAGIIFCAWKKESTWTCLFAVISGAYATFGYLTTPIYTTGKSYIIHLIAAILLTVGSLPLVALWVKKIVRWFTVAE